MQLSWAFARTISISLAVCAVANVVLADVVLVEEGSPGTAIVVSEEVMRPDVEVNLQTPYEPYQAEMGRRRVRESVIDLGHYLGKMTESIIPIVHESPDGGAVPIYVGQKAIEKFGLPEASDQARQGWRMVVRPDAVGLLGESVLGTSYAIYELLHRLGCRWYMPSEMGEYVPSKASIRLPIGDTSSVPSTLYRTIWYADDAFKRRNRQGGLVLNTRHQFEYYITKDQLEQHPEWLATIDGKPQPRRISWTRPEVRQAIAERILEQLDDRYKASMSLSPVDGVGWDEGYDTQYDAGDWDPAMDIVSKTDRLIFACNDIVTRVNKKYPEVFFGVHAYVDYTRPPVREKVHPKLVPVIAPITYNRAHPMTAEGHPNGFELKELVEGWGRTSDKIGCYWFGYNLAEVSAPNPFITKWGTDVPLLIKNNARFWQPETMRNFETTMIGIYLGMRLSWDATLNPQDIVAELMTNFYGAAAGPMSRYWHHIDRAWIEADEYSGGGSGYLRIFTPEVMTDARTFMDDGLAACQTVTEFRRVQMANESLVLFERFMKMRKDLAEGRLKNLKQDIDAWRGYAFQLAESYQEQYAFSRWVLSGKPQAWTVTYFDGRFAKPYEDGARVARDFVLLTENKPIREWKYRVDENDQSEQQGWQKVDFGDGDWKTTDVGIETWSTIGHHNHFGKMWYRAAIEVPKVPAGKKVYLWIPSTDGSVKVFVNGNHVPYVNSKGESSETFKGFASPVSFDITQSVKAGETNHLALLCDRTADLNDVGIGGLMAPPMLYREK